MSTRHIRAVNKSIRARGLDKSPAHAPIVMLAQDIARQMDAAGPNGPSGRLQERYRGALKQLGSVPAPRSDASSPEKSGPNMLEEFMRKWKIGPKYSGGDS